MKRNSVVLFAALVAISSLALTVGTAAGPPAAIITWAGTPQSAPVNSNFQIMLVAVVRDASGNGVQGSTVTFTAPSSGPSGAFNGALTATATTDSSGIARAPAFRANGVGGSFVLTATTTGVQGSAQFSLQNTGGAGGGGSGLPVAPANLRILSSSGPASSVTPASGSGQATTVNTTFATALQARVTDASSNPVAGVTVTFTLPPSGPTARFSGSAVATAATDGNGFATAPPLTANGTTGSYTASAAAAGVAAPATFSLTNAVAGTPPPPISGTWSNVTPSGMTMDPNGTAAGATNNYGVQGVIADPVRPGTLYATATYQGLWRSTNYGATWSKVTVTSGPSPLDNGRGALYIAPDGSYLLTTALYPINGHSNGAWKSTNGGQTWTRYNVGASNGDDLGYFAIHRTDPLRVVAIPHSAPFNMYESRDGGQTWTSQGLIGSTRGADPFWVDDNTIIAIGDGDNGPGPGTWRGVRSSATWPWTWNWTRVSSQQHWHGIGQPFIDPNNGHIFIGGGYGIQRSTDNGVSWTTVSNTFSAGIVATPTVMFSTANYASHGGFGPYFMRADRASGGLTWASDSVPGALNNGWLKAAVVHDGSRYVLVSGNWNAGIWRLVIN